MQFLNRDGTLSQNWQLPDTRDAKCSEPSWLAVAISDADDLLACVRAFTSHVLHQAADASWCRPVVTTSFVAPDTFMVCCS